MRVEFVHMRLHDLGAEVALAKVGTLAGHAVKPAPPSTDYPAPSYGTFPRPVESIFPWQGGPAGATVEVRLHALGAIAVRLRWTADVASLDEVAAAAAAVPGGQAGLDRFADAQVEAVRQSIVPALKSSYATSVAPEPYLVYCLQPQPGETQRLLTERRPRLAALVSGEAEELTVPARIESAFRHLLQYDADDAVIPGWEHAVVLGHGGGYEDVLDVMELANLELLEFRTYDAYLDRRLDESFERLDKLWSRGGIFRSARRSLQDISRFRVEMARLTDNLQDTGKVFGDWYPAQLHKRLHERFHLSSWERAIKVKSEALEDMFHLAQEEANHRRSLLLEALIVLLFVLDLFILVRQGA